jgi:aryl carrier-like protein
MTSNPFIVEKAVADSHDCGESIRVMALAGSWRAPEKVLKHYTKR